MKKVIALTLAFLLILFLSACSKSNDSNTPYNTSPNASVNSSTATETTEDAVVDTVQANKYQQAIRLLNSNRMDNSSYRQAYELLVELGDYKDAKEYLGRFTIIPNVRLCATSKETNAFGEVVKEIINYYCYNSLGEIVFEPVNSAYSGSIAEEYYRYIYDTDGKLTIRQYIPFLTSSMYENKNWPVDSNTTYSYNQDGLIIEAVKKNNNGLTQSIEKRFYNDAGWELRREVKSDTGNITVTEYIYDETDRLIKAVLSRSENDKKSIIANTEYTYDETGQLVNKTIISFTTTIYTYFYENGVLIRAEVSKENEDVTYITHYTNGDYYCYTP